MIKSKLLLAIIPLILLYSDISLSKEEPNLHSVRWYKVYYSSFNVGDLIISVDKKGEIYDIAVAIKSKSIAKTATKYWCNAITQVKEIERGKDRIYKPQRFQTVFSLRKKDRNIDIQYNDMGEVVGFTNTPPENPKKRPPIPDKLKNGTYDPLSAAAMIRDKVRELRDNGQLDRTVTKLSLPLFDGRRRSDLNFTIHGRTTQTVMEKDMKVIHISFENMPVAGYTENEMKNLPKHNPKINVYISDDDLLLPVRGDGETRIGWATGGLYKECASLAECGGPIKIN